MTQPQTAILKNNNDPDSSGRHIAPGKVKISSVIAVNMVSDVIYRSFQNNLERSNQAQRGYILYAFAQLVPPESLIIQGPINLRYL